MYYAWILSPVLNNIITIVVRVLESLEDQSQVLVLLWHYRWDIRVSRVIIEKIYSLSKLHSNSNLMQESDLALLKTLGFTQNQFRNDFTTLTLITSV